MEKNSALPIDEHAPEDVRDAVRQLSLAFRRGQETIESTREEVEAEALRRAEAVLFAAGEPLSAEQVTECVPQGADVTKVLLELQRQYQNKGVNLIEVDGRWRFQTAADLAFLFVEERHEQKKLSQAALETLAIIAYAQPVTRAEIEDVRGVAVSKDTVDKLMEAGWVKVKGRRKTPGRPVTLGTTATFLEHFGLESLEMLPGRAELEAQGLLSSRIPDGFEAGQGGPSSTSDEDGFTVSDDDADAGFHTDFMGEGDGEDD